MMHVFKLSVFFLLYTIDCSTALLALPSGWPENKILILPDMGRHPILTAIKSAKKSIDITGYHLDDPQVIEELIQSRRKGIRIRLILQKPYLYPSPFDNKINEATSIKLKNHGIETHFLEDYRYPLVHYKLMIIDNEYAIVQNFNYEDRNFKARNFGLTIENKEQVQALSKIFENDYNGKSLENDKESLTLWNKTRIILGPLYQRKLIMDLLRSAKSSIHIYQQDLCDPEMGKLLSSLAKEGKKIEVIMVPAPFGGVDSNRINQTIITASGGQFRFKPKNELYIHAKVILIDPEKKGQMYIGSCNFWSECLSRNRELGVVTNNKSQIQVVYDTFKKDWQSSYSYDEASDKSTK
jgi:cardiolipin synthase A/B